MNATGEKDIFVSEHFLDDGNCALLVVNNGTRPYSATPALRDGWRVTGAMTDDHESAKWADGTLTLAPCAGIVLMVRQMPRKSGVHQMIRGVCGVVFLLSAKEPLP